MSEILTNEDNHKKYRSSMILTIIIAALEYFISIMVGSNYLAYLSTAIGIDAGTTGILNSFVSLGCGFQIVALFMRGGRRIKPLVVFMNVANQLCFTFLYLIPLVDIPPMAKTTVFIVLLLAGHILMNLLFSPRVVWFKGLIPPKQLGVISTTSEMISLISGMGFTMLMGSLIDYFEAAGNMTAVFITCGITIATLTIANTICILFTKEKEPSAPDTQPAQKRLKSAITDRATLTLIPLFVLWEFAHYGCISFFYTYAQDTLEFNMTTLALLSTVYAIVRSVVSIPMGKIGDKYSFATMITLGMVAFVIGLGFNAFGGAVNYWIFYILYAITMAGTNSAKMNIIYSSVTPERRTGAVSILYTIGGFVGFFSTIAMRPLHDYVQNSGNSIFGIENVYPSQVLSVVGIIVTIIAIVYVNLVIRKMPKPAVDEKELTEEATRETAEA